MVNSNMMRRERKLVAGAKLSFMFSMECCEVKRGDIYMDLYVRVEAPRCGVIMSCEMVCEELVQDVDKRK